MEIRYLYIVLSFFLSMICGLVFIPQIIRYCKSKKLYDLPNQRKVHTNAIPRLGGVSFMPSMIITGMRKDSNCTARMKYTRQVATIMARPRVWKFSIISV